MPDKPIRVLFRSDSAGDAETVIAMLEGVQTPFEIEVAKRLESALQAVAQQRFHVILADLNLPDSYGLETFLALQRVCPEHPIILLTGLEDEEVAQNAMERGAQDYLVKNAIDDRLLDRSIRYAIERKKILLENIRLYDSAERASRAKDEFLAMLSHELRTPLTAILGWAVLMRDGKLPPVQINRALASIEQNARIQGRIIDELLDISRIITAKLSLNVKKFINNPSLDWSILFYGRIIDELLDISRIITGKLSLNVKK